MKIAGKEVVVPEDFDFVAPTDGQLLTFDAGNDKWVAISAGQLPVSVAGVTATTLDAALLEIFEAI